MGVAEFYVQEGHKDDQQDPIPEERVSDDLGVHVLDVNEVDEQGQTPLMRAAKNGHKDLAEHLITHGANIEQADKNGHTAYDMATAYGRNDIIKILGLALTAMSNPEQTSAFA